MSAHLKFVVGGHTSGLYDAPTLNVWGLEPVDVPAELLEGGWVFEARQVTLRWRGHKMAFVDLGTRTLLAMNAGDTPRNISDFGAAATARRRQAAAAASANATASAVAATAARHVRRLAAAPAGAAAAPAMSPDPQRAAAAFVPSPPSSARTSALAPTPPVVPTPPEDLDA